MGLTDRSTAVPAWVERLKQEKELLQAKTAAAAERDRADRLQVESDGPKFWNAFVKELQNQSPHLIDLGIRASATVMGATAGVAEAICHVEMASTALHPQITNANFFYGKGQTEIRSVGMMRTPSFRFQIFPQGLKAVSDDSSFPMDAEQAAEVVLERMATHVTR